MGEIDDAISYVKSLPLDDTPETFGLHSNAELTFQQNEVKQFVHTIQSLQQRGGGDSGGSATDSVIELAKLLQNRVPKLINFKKVHPKSMEKLKNGAITSLGIFLSQEVVRFNRLITVIKNSLQGIQLIITPFFS